jgi:polyketide cyclase/dehydrase/lipid transport protein
VLSHEVESFAPPTAAWALVARPARWHEWAPHVRGAWGLQGADGEVRLGARGAARLLGAIPVPAVVNRKVPGRAWTWRVGPVELDHRVEPRTGGGCVVAVDLRAPAPLEAVLRVTYGPVVALLVRNLARAAERAG